MSKRLIVLLVTAVLVLSGCTLEDLKKTGAETGEASPEPTSVKAASTHPDNSREDFPSQSPVVDKKEYISVIIYYQDGDGFLIPVTRKLPKQEGVARASLNGLIDSAAAREEINYYGIFPVLPEGTQVLGLTIKEGTAVVDFDDGLLNYKDAAAERNIIGSVVYTLTEFDSVKGVEILIAGRKKEKLKFGSDLSTVYTRQNTMLNSEKLLVDASRSKVDIYLDRLVKDNFLYTAPVSFESERLEQKDLPYKIIDLLKKDYSPKKLYSGITPDSTLLDCIADKGTVSLYFNKAFRNYGGTSRESSILKQLYYSMKQVEGMKSLRIYVDGTEGNLPEGSDIAGGYSITAEINHIIDK